MKLADKPLDLKPVTVKAAIAAFERAGRAQDAQDMRAQIEMVADFTTWTADELLSLEFTEWPVLARQFAELMGGIRDRAINPPSATSSASLPVEPVAPSPAGQTS